MRTLPSALARRALVLRAATAAALLIGYADLVSGGITLAPLAIVLAYVVLVPTVILTWQ